MRESVTVFTSLVMIRQLAVKHFVTNLGISVVKLLYLFLFIFMSSFSSSHSGFHLPGIFQLSILHFCLFI
jgi:hypothetical protein